MLFNPQHYQTEQDIKNASIMEASSDTIIDNQEVFGYVNGIPYQAIYTFCPKSEQYYSIAGGIIPV